MELLCNSSMVWSILQMGHDSARYSLVRALYYTYTCSVNLYHERQAGRRPCQTLPVVLAPLPVLHVCSALTFISSRWIRIILVLRKGRRCKILYHSHSPKNVHALEISIFSFFSFHFSFLFMLYFQVPIGGDAPCAP